MIDRSTIPSIQLDFSKPVNRAARQLVLNKYLLDKAVKEQGGDMLAGDLCDGAYGLHEPLPFLSRVLPFFFMRKLASEMWPALVPTSNTLGCSWRKSMSTFDGKDVQSTIQYLTDVDGLMARTLDDAYYAWFPALGLAAPLEGKNRVDFLRGQGVEFIPAYVNEGQYLAPERIQLYTISVGTNAETWAVLDGRWVEKVAHPSWTCPVMDAYGVSIRSAWPAELPAPEHVLQAFLGREGVTYPLGHPDYPGRPVVDLKTLQAVISYREEVMACRVGQLENVRVNPKLWAICGALVLIGLAGLSFAPVDWAILRGAMAFALGVGLTGAILPALAPFLLTQRQRVGHTDHLPLELAPKRCIKTIKRLG